MGDFTIFFFLWSEAKIFDFFFVKLKLSKNLNVTSWMVRPHCRSTALTSQMVRLNRISDHFTLSNTITELLTLSHVCSKHQQYIPPKIETRDGKKALNIKINFGISGQFELSFQSAIIYSCACSHKQFPYHSVPNAMKSQTWDFFIKIYNQIVILIIDIDHF